VKTATEKKSMKKAYDSWGIDPEEEKKIKKKEEASVRKSPALRFETKKRRGNPGIRATLGSGEHRHVSKRQRMKRGSPGQEVRVPKLRSKKRGEGEK